jgi:hypothetical protein
MLIAPTLAVSVICASTAAQPPTTPSPLHPIGNGPVMPLAFDAAAYHAIDGLDTLTITGFPLPTGERVDLLLHKLDVLAPGARLVVGDPHGDLPMAAPDVTLLSGAVPGHDGSTVFLSLSPLGSNGVIELDGRTLVLSSGRHGAGLQPVIYDIRALPEGALQWRETPIGASDVLTPAQPAPRAPGGGTAAVLPCRLAQIAFDSDWEYTKNLFDGDAEASAAYILTLAGAVSEIYARDLNTRLQIPYLRVWASNTDPYTEQDNINWRIIEFRDHWMDTKGNIDRTLAHCLTGMNDGPFGGGVAWSYGGLCDYSKGYAVSDVAGYFPYPLEHKHQDNWDPFVVAHEIGHNFAALHTHDMDPPIDRCYPEPPDCSEAGTIMSYCYICPGHMTNIDLVLHKRTIDENILPYLATVCDLTVQEASIIEQPEDASVCEGAGVALSVVADGDLLTYQWRHDGEPIPGADDTSYTIEDASPEDAGEYDVIVSNVCGDVASQPATVAIGACEADLTGDCTLDLFDFLEFVNLFNSADPKADCDTSGALDLFDFLCYTNEFNAGC